MFRTSSNDSLIYMLSASKYNTLEKLRNNLIRIALNRVLNMSDYALLINAIKCVGVSYDYKPIDINIKQRLIKEVCLAIYLMIEIKKHFGIHYAYGIITCISKFNIFDYDYLLIPDMCSMLYGLKQWKYSSDKSMEITKLLRDKGLKRTNFKSNRGFYSTNDKMVFSKMKLILGSDNFFISIKDIKEKLNY